MNRDNAHKKFIFNDQFDSEFLFGLYEHDYAYILEVFQNTLEYLESDGEQVKTAYQKGDIELFQKAVHKIKPVFGFTGLINMQQTIATIEKTIHASKDDKALEAAYHSVISVINQARQAIEIENKRLLEYIGLPG